MKGYYGNNAPETIERLTNLIFTKGGFTLSSSLNKIQKTNGYIVGSKNMFIRQGIALSKLELDALIEACKKTPNLYIGAWFDTTDNRTHYDISEWVCNKKAAITLAKERDELAIWDCAESCEIPTK